MSRIGTLSLIFSAISFACLIMGRVVLGGWHDFLWIPLGLFLVFFIYPIATEGRSLIRTTWQFMTMKTTKRGLSMGSMILLVLAGLIIVNVISVRHYATWDFSMAHSNTLSEQSIKLLKTLDADLKFTFFYKQGQEGAEENRRSFRELVKKYQDQSDRVRLDFVEVNERPDLASEYGVTKGSGIVFLEYKGRRNRIEKIDEQDVTSALVKVSSGKSKVVYFVVGHGEMDLDEMRDTSGGNALKMLLANNNYDVRTLPLNQKGKIPGDADIVAIIGPDHGFLGAEISALDEYLKGGGNLWIALNSGHAAGLEKLLAEASIVPENNIVLNVTDRSKGDRLEPSASVANQFSTNDNITKVFPPNEMVVMQMPMGLKKGKVPASLTIDEMVRSLEDSKAFKNMKFEGAGENGVFTFGMDVVGAWPGSGDKAKQMKLVVFGDAHFLSNALLYQNLNRDLAFNTVAALSHDENVISIAPRDPGITKMELTDIGFRVFFWGFILPLPFLMLAISIGLWMRRRNA